MGFGLDLGCLGLRVPAEKKTKGSVTDEEGKQGADLDLGHTGLHVPTEKKRRAGAVFEPMEKERG
jgi:hypothetical protein